MQSQAPIGYQPKCIYEVLRTVKIGLWFLAGMGHNINIFERLLCEHQLTISS